MPITYDSIFGAPTDEERMRAAADRLRRREAFATLGAFTGDPVLGQWGRGEMENLREQAQALRKGRQEAMRLRPTGTPGYMMRGNEVVPMAGYEQAQQRRAQEKRDLQVLKATQSAEAAARKREQAFEDRVAFEREKLNMPTRTQAASARETRAYLPEIQELTTQLQDIGEIPIGPEVGAGAARSLPLSMGEAAAAGIERAGMSENAVDWLARGRKFEQDIIRLASGLAVTGFELENVKKWSPYALGLTNRERTERLQNIYNQLGRESSAIMNEPWENVDFSQTTVETPEGSAAVTEGRTPVGTIEDGYRFLGGDDSKAENWEKVE